MYLVLIKALFFSPIIKSVNNSFFLVSREAILFQKSISEGNYQSF